jgi:hypothetical protein
VTGRQGLLRPLLGPSVLYVYTCMYVTLCCEYASVYVCVMTGRKGSLWPLLGPSVLCVYTYVCNSVCVCVVTMRARVCPQYCVCMCVHVYACDSKCVCCDYMRVLVCCDCGKQGLRHALLGPSVLYVYV